MSNGQASAQLVPEIAPPVPAAVPSLHTESGNDFVAVPASAEAGSSNADHDMPGHKRPRSDGVPDIGGSSSSSKSDAKQTNALEAKEATGTVSPAVVNPPKVQGSKAPTKKRRTDLPSSSSMASDSSSSKKASSCDHSGDAPAIAQEAPEVPPSIATPGKSSKAKSSPAKKTPGSQRRKRPGNMRRAVQKELRMLGLPPGWSAQGPGASGQKGNARSARAARRGSLSSAATKQDPPVPNDTSASSSSADSKKGPLR